MGRSLAPGLARLARYWVRSSASPPARQLARPEAPRSSDCEGMMKIGFVRAISAAVSIPFRLPRSGPHACIIRRSISGFPDGRMENGFVRAVSGVGPCLTRRPHCEGTMKIGFVRAISGVGVSPGPRVDCERTMKIGFVCSISGVGPFDGRAGDCEGTMKIGFVCSISGVGSLAVGGGRSKWKASLGFVRATSTVAGIVTGTTKRAIDQFRTIHALATCRPSNGCRIRGMIGPRGQPGAEAILRTATAGRGKR
jgi:hypothetical protein